MILFLAEENAGAAVYCSDKKWLCIGLYRMPAQVNLLPWLAKGLAHIAIGKNGLLKGRISHFVSQED